MRRRKELLRSISETIQDYRRGEVTITPEHVATWLGAFDESVHVEVLKEMDHVLARSYLSRARVMKFLQATITNPRVAGEKPRRFWRTSTVLDAQRAGQSQSELRTLLDELLQARWGRGVDDSDRTSNTFVYLDDAIFSGNRVLNDLRAWIEGRAPDRFHLRVVVLAAHNQGVSYARRELEIAAERARKDMTLKFRAELRLENVDPRTSDVLWPTELTDDGAVATYAAYLGRAGFPPSRSLRPGRSRGSARFFSSGARRHLLEQQFLRQGVRVRELCTNLKEQHRPLGYSRLRTLGFGTMLVTYRNCPNTCPLVMWAGTPWYPLFPRRTNATYVDLEEEDT